jgi:HlyD family secretion protein
VLTQSEPQLFNRQQVSIGMSDGINIEIKDGLTEGQKVRGNQTE